MGGACMCALIGNWENERAELRMCVVIDSWENEPAELVCVL